MDFGIVTGALWTALFLVWLVGAFFAKRAARRQSRIEDLFQRTLGVLAWFVGFSRFFRFEPLTAHFLPDSAATASVGVALTAAGIAFAIWARFFLGGNWSGTVTVKTDHTLVRKGPYSVVRHPIYSGLLLAVIGTAVVFNQTRCLIAVALVLIIALFKIRIEETFMTEQFGSEYVEYKNHVKALVPKVW